MHDFAYGYNLVYNTKTTNKQDTVFINKTTKLLLKNHPFKVKFQTNQDREIFIAAKKDFTQENFLKEFVFVVEDVVSFSCDSKKSEVLYFEDEKYTDYLMNYWLIHVVLPMYFTLNSTYYFLHTGSVCIKDKATLFTGLSHVGKSTLTNFFLQKDHYLVSDDKLATFTQEGEFYCKTSHSHHRPYRDTETLGLKAKNFSKNTLKIGPIYWLKQVDAKDNIVISELHGLKKFEALRYATEMELFVNKEQRFEYVTKLSNYIKVYEIQVPRDMKRLEEVYDKIIDNNRSV